MTRTTVRPGDAFDERYATFADLADHCRDREDLDIEAAATRAAEIFLRLHADAELVETCRDRYAREGGK